MDEKTGRKQTKSIRSFKAIKRERGGGGVRVSSKPTDRQRHR